MTIKFQSSSYYFEQPIGLLYEQLPSDSFNSTKTTHWPSEFGIQHVRCRVVNTRGVQMRNLIHISRTILLPRVRILSSIG